jgi:hypothetical protein
LTYGDWYLYQQILNDKLQVKGISPDRAVIPPFLTEVKSRS